MVVPSKNSTFVTVPLASDAVAEIVIEFPSANCALFNGAVIDTTGRVFVLVVTVIVTADDVVTRFPLSVALAVSTCIPFAALFQAKL